MQKKKMMQKRAGAVVTAAAMLLTAIPSAVYAAEEVPAAPEVTEEAVGADDQQLLASFDFESAKENVFDGKGAKAKAIGNYELQDAAETGSKAIYLNGSSYLEVTGEDGNSLLTGMKAITFSFDAKADKNDTGWYYYAAPDNRAQGSPEYYIGGFINNGNLKAERYLNGRTQALDGISVGSGWAHIDVNYAEDGTYVYVNDTLAKSVSGAVSLADILGGSSILQIGKANWGSGEYFKGWLDNFQIYGEKIPAEEVLAKDLEALSLADVVTDDFELKKIGNNGSVISWSVPENAYLVVEGNLAKVTRPEQADAQVVLTAAAEIDGVKATREFTITIRKELADKDVLAEAQEKLEIYNADSIMGNITLPEELSAEGSNKKVSVSWTSSAPEVITDKKEGAKDAGVVTRPAADTPVTLTAQLVCGKEKATKVFEVTVKKKPAPKAKNTSYLFAYFTGGEGRVTDEQIYFSTSLDGCQWTDMTEDRNPVLTSEIGDKGVRDPYLIRSAEGDKFYLIATDLSIYYRGGWGRAEATTKGSTKLVVWESTDLIDWTEPRLVDVAGAIPGAGCAWAPEAYYDAETGNYVLYWATASDESNNLGDRMNMYYCTTRDFYTFSKPVIWIDRNTSVIDTTMIYDDVTGYYYRASGDGQITIDRSKSIYDGWETIGTLKDIFNNDRYSGAKLEGPEFFEYCEDDWQKDADGNPVRTWGLMCDQYSEGRGYLPFRTTNLGDMSTESWSPASDVNFGPLKKRHGTILAVTNNEYKAIMEHFGFDASDVPDDPEPTPEPTPTVTPEPTPTVTPEPTPTSAPEPTKVPHNPSPVKKTFSVNGVKYKVTKDDAKGLEVCAVGLETGKKALKIPATVRSTEWKATFKVTSVKASAFKGKGVTSVVIGKNVTKIGSGAFLNCKKLKSVVIGKNVKTIGPKAFYGCKKLKKITIKSTVLRNVKKNAFKKIAKKAVVKVPKGKKTGYRKTLKGKIDKNAKIK